MTGEPSATNGVQAVESDGSASVEQPKLTRAQQDAAARDAFLAATDDEILEASKPAGKTEKVDPKKKAKAEPKIEDDEDEDDDVETSDDEDDDDEIEAELDEIEDEEDELEEDLEDDANDPDPEVAKRLAKVQKREKHVLERAEARDRAFEQQRQQFVSEWKPKIEAAEAFEKKFTQLKANKDLPGLLKLLEFSDDDFEDYSQILWGLSKTGRADPKYKAASAQLQLQRELREKIDAADARSKALEAQIAKRDEDAATNAKVDHYLGRVSKAVTDATPRAAKALELTPKKARAELQHVAYKLAKKAGGFVEPKKVIQAYEKKLTRAAEFHKKLAGDDTPEKPAAPKKKPAIDVVDKTKKAGASAGSASKPLFKSRAEMIEDLRKIEHGELDPEAD